MSDEWGRDSMEAWSRDRGLTFEVEGLFAARTSLLREGLGAGTHRAGVILSETAHSLTSAAGFSKKPERHTANITRGRLPGGLERAVGHHFHLELRQTGHDDDWLASPHSLSVAVPGVVEAAPQLDQLCRIASAVADGARRVARSWPLLDPTAPTRAQALPPTEQWAESLGSRLQWPQPPASVPAAFDAYAGLTQGGGRITRWEVNRAALIAVVVVGIVGFGAAAVLAFVFDNLLEGAAVAAACIIGAPKAIRAALHAGDDIEDAQAGLGLDLVALEAFARDDRFQVQYWNLAVVAEPAGDVPGVLPGFRVERVGSVLVIAEQVPDEGRSVERLDALRATAVRAAGGVPELQSG
jgi:hypothetical protein